MRKNFTLDDSGFTLKAAGLIAASAAVATIADLGAGYVEGNVVIDVTALEIADNDELYDIVVQLSSDSDFGTDTNIVEKCALSLSAAEVKRTDANKDDIIGRHILPFNNLYATTVYRYLRIYTVVAGTIATGINYTARIAKR